MAGTGTRNLLSGALILLAAGIGLLAWSRLPAEMAIHFSAGGTPDSFVPRSVGVSLVPALMVLTTGVLRGAMALDPSEDPRVPAVVDVSTLTFMATLHLLVVAWNLGYGAPFELVFVGALVWSGAMVAYALWADPPW
ncbi:MAG: DUF1648 domain-containing protein [Halorhabdus sp.]